ncbi:addiction module protein [Niveispirillum sp. BGYR6]|uniref:addiction module protein n=1 Tax=Niveispirillum sp. BGYR6 TaxID=2971249 RepID=UPI0022B9C5E2|nr:addiction module protein [Niveispirillum sp. BGYR6]MDG5497721.1 addiction module protein [Niveispirillum sp. BGYR6]
MTVIDFSHLSPEQRLQLIGELCDSLEPENVPLSPAWKVELAQRSRDLRAGKGQSIPLAQAMDELHRRNR